MIKILTRISTRQLFFCINLNNQFNFSSTGIKCQHQLKALLAYQTIKLITSQPHQLNKSSLQQKIIKTIKLYKGSSQELEQAKSEFLKYFIDGVRINSIIFPAKTTKFGQKIEKIVFCPTYLTTGHIFNKLLGCKKRNNIMYGHFDTSKKMSLLLYSQLSNIISSYLLQYHNDQNCMINRNNFIHVPKLIYWNIEKTHLDQQRQKQDKIISEIYKQFNQVPNMFDNQQGDLLKTKIREIYNQQNIKLILFIDNADKITRKIGATKQRIRKMQDQIDQDRLAFHLSQKGLNYTQYSKSLWTNKELQKNYSNLKLANNQIQSQLRLIKFIKEVSKNFDNIIQITSINKKQSILIQIAKVRHQYQFRNYNQKFDLVGVFNSQSIINPQQISQQLEYKNFILELVDNFIFEYKNYLKLIVKSFCQYHKIYCQKDIEYIRNSLASQFRGYYIFYFIHANIKQYFTNQFNYEPQKNILQLQSNNIDKYTLLDKMQSLISDIAENQMLYYQNSLKNFISKYIKPKQTRQARLKLLTKFYYESKRLMLTQKDVQNKPISLKISDLKIINQQISKTNKTSDKFYNSIFYQIEEQNRNLFQLRYSKNGLDSICTRFSLGLTQQFFGQIIQDIIDCQEQNPLLFPQLNVQQKNNL